MSAKFYAVLLLVAILGLFWYQNHYLQKLKGQAIHWDNPLQEPLPVAAFQGTQIVFYEGDHLKKTLAAEEAIQYNDRTFILKDSVRYEHYDDRGKKSMQIFSDRAEGQWDEKHENLLFLDLPQQIDFEFLGYKGKARNVHFDAQQKTLSSDQPFVATGPGGTICATGFTYWIEKEAFVFDAQVEGEAHPKELEKTRAK